MYAGRTQYYNNVWAASAYTAKGLNVEPVVGGWGVTRCYYRRYTLLYITFTTGASSKGVAEAAAAAGEEQLQRNQRSPRTTAAEPYSTHGRRPRSPPPPPLPPPSPPPPSAQVPQTLDGRQSPTDRHRTSARLRQQSFSHTAHRRHRRQCVAIGDYRSRSANIIIIIRLKIKIIFK